MSGIIEEKSHKGLTKKEKTEKRRKLIDSSAKKLFLKNGYRSTSVDEIAKDAGYSKRTVYLDYKNKDDIFLKIATDGLEQIIHQLEAIPDSNNLHVYITQYLKTITDFSLEHTAYFKLLIVDVTADIISKASDKQRKRAARLEKRGTQLLADKIEKAISEGIIKKTGPWETAEIIIGSAVGIIQLSAGGSQTILNGRKLSQKIRRLGEYIYLGLC